MEQKLLEVMKDSIKEILVGLYDAVRIVEVGTHDQYVFTPDGSIIKQEINCHDLWQRAQPCPNCVARRARNTLTSEEKIEMYGDKIFLVVGMPIAEGEFIIEIVKDITDLFASKNEILCQYEKLRQQLEELTHTTYLDALTGIWNRRFIQERFPSMVKSAETLGKRLAVMMVDIDHFKKINDTYGHAQGDEVLRVVAKILQRGIRNQDAAVRYGGEEFTVILYDVPEHVALRIAERMRSQISQEEISLEGYQVSVTVSIGVAFNVHGTKAEDIINTADRRLYLAKQQGRNRVVWED